VIIQDGLRRMLSEQQNVFYYVTVMNENYAMPSMPEGAATGILKGMYLLREATAPGPRAQLLGSGTILREVLAGADLLAQDFGVASDVWSVTSFGELRREGMDCERHNMLHPTQQPRVSYVAQCFKDRAGPVVAASDYVKLSADRIRPLIDRDYTVLGTDGFGRSDTREELRRFFEVDRYYVVVATLSALSRSGEVPTSKVAEAIAKYGINPEKINPLYA
jgi:pyruvate dehydrogenase E1 component